MTQQVGLHQSQLDRIPVDAQFELSEVDDAPVERERVGGRRLPDAHPLASAQQSLQPCQQDGKFERLGKIVVGSGSETLEHVLGAAAGSQPEPGNEVLRGAQPGGDGETVLAGKHDIEHDSIKFFALSSLLVTIFFMTVFLAAQQQLDGALAVSGNFDAVAFGFEIETQSLRDVRFILDNQHAAHARFSRTVVSGAWFDLAWFSLASLCRETLRGSSTTTVVP